MIKSQSYLIVLAKLLKVTMISWLILTNLLNYKIYSIKSQHFLSWRVSKGKLNTSKQVVSCRSGLQLLKVNKSILFGSQIL